MQKSSRLLITALLALGLTGVLSISACSDSEPRSHSRNIMKELDKAQRLYAKAVQLLGSVPFKVTNKTVTWIEGLDPKAVDAIDQAENILRAAMKENKAAPDSTLALANTELAQVLMLKAHCESLKASAAREKAASAAREAHSVMSAIRDQSGAIGFLAKLSSMNNTDIETAATETAGTIATLTKTIQKQQQALSANKASQAELARETDSLSDTARGIRQKADLAAGEESLKLFVQSQKYDKQAHAKLTEMRLLEQKSATIKSDIAALNMRLASAQDRLALIKSIVARGNKTAEASQTAKDEIATAKTGAKARATKLLANYAAASKDISSAQSAAIKLYDEAATLFGKAAKVNGRSPAALASQADALTSIAAVHSNTLAASKEGSLLAEHAIAASQDEDWTLSEQTGAIKQYVSDPAKTRKDAADMYLKALKLYEKAIKLADRNHTWVYQAQVAKAHFGIALMDKNPDELRMAKEAVTEALDGKRSSPYLQDVVQLEKLILAAE